MSEVKRIAQIIGNARSGGVISCVLNFYRHIDKTEFQFDFYTYGESPFDDEIRKSGGRVFYFSDIHNIFKAYKDLKNYFTAQSYYAVHAHLTTLSFLPLMAAKACGINNRICHAHSTAHISEKNYFLKKCLSLYSNTFATETAGCSWYSINWLYGNKQGKKSFLLHNAIDMKRFEYCKEKNVQTLVKYGFEEKKIIGSVGRLVYQKNYIFLIDAFAELAQKAPNIILVIVGQGKEKAKILQKIKKNHLEDRVFLFPESREIEKYYKIFDLFVLTSRFEGLPLAVVEAQSIGLPCLLSSEITSEANIGGNVEFLPIKNHKKWAQKMYEMLSLSKRYDVTDKITAAGYNLKTESLRLCEFYRSLEK